VTEAEQPPATYSAVIAEDDPDIRLLLTHSLEDWGFEVVALDTGDRAMTAIREIRPDIVLLDINMPGLSGHEIIKVMRREPGLRDIPAMLITAETAGPVAQSGLAQGADDYVRKPFHLGELKQRVLRLTSRARDLRALTSLQEAVSLPDAIRDRGGVRAVGLNRPFPGALAGGDFLAVTTSPGGQVTAIVGDVEGHGIEAAALAAFTRAVLATNAAFTDQPGLLLSLADWTLAQRDRPGTDLPLVTATCLVIDPCSRTMRWASAGHPAPVCFSDRVVPKAQVGAPLGVGPKPFFPVHERTLGPGERILLFTDGLMRATFGNSDFTEAVLPWLLLQGADVPLPELLTSIHLSFNSFPGGNQDDLWLLLLEAPLR
jgi:two-component system, OmpR family, phosphate regulon response regulator PhoB